MRLLIDQRGRRVLDRSKAGRTKLSDTMGANTEITAPKLWIVLARCHRAIAIAVERSIAELGLCLSDLMVLEALLHKGPLTISEIQAKVLLASGSMTAAVDRVESMGLVKIGSSSTDRRAKVLH